MPTITEAQLIANGFTRIAGAGERIQHWVGAHPSTGLHIDLLWDSTTERQKVVPNSLSVVDLYRMLVGLCLLTNDLAQSRPDLSAGQKSGFQGLMLELLNPD